MDERERQLRRAHDAARSAERWATASVWGSGCALAAYMLAALAVLAVIGVVVWVALSVG